MKFLYRYFALEYVYKKAGIVSLFFLFFFLILILFGFWAGLIEAPRDYQQGNSFRIIYVHVPAAWMSLMIYVLMAISSFTYLVWRFKLAYYFTRASASIGAVFTLISLLTGAIWGKPMWGTYWVWDARLTSQLILFFIYISYIGLVSGLNNQKSAAKLGSIFCLIGLVNIPIIYFSVEWWNTLHQGPSIQFTGKSGIYFSMIWPLFVNAIATKFLYGALVLINIKNQILIHHGSNAWLIKAVKNNF